MVFLSNERRTISHVFYPSHGSEKDKNLSPMTHVLLLNFGCIGRHITLLLRDFRMTSVFFKMADVNAEYFKVKLNLFKR